MIETIPDWHVYVYLGMSVFAIVATLWITR